MSVTVLCEIRPHPDQADAVIQRWIEQLSLPSRDVAGRRFARLYQHVDDPAWLLYLAEWSSRDAFDAHRQTAPMPGTPGQFQALPTHRFYRRLALFERVLSPVSVVHIDVVDGPAETHAIRRDLALAYHRSSVRGRSGLVLLQVHEALGTSSGLLILSGWEAASPLQRAAQELERAMLDQLSASSGTVQQYVGRALIETSSI